MTIRFTENWWDQTTRTGYHVGEVHTIDPDRPGHPDVSEAYLVEELGVAGKVERDHTDSDQRWRPVEYETTSQTDYETTVAQADTTSDTTPDVSLEDRLDELPYRKGGDGLYGVATDVAARVDATLSSRSSADLVAFCLDHADVTRQVLEE